MGTASSGSAAGSGNLADRVANLENRCTTIERGQEAIQTTMTSNHGQLMHILTQIQGGSAGDRASSEGKKRKSNFV